MTSPLESYINYRIDRAFETFKDAEMLAQNERWNSSINRLYYPCFYIVNALLLKKGLDSKTHSGVKTLFFKEFILTQVVSKEFGRHYSDLFDWRNEGDYGDFIKFERSIVEPAILKTKLFLVKIEKVIKLIPTS